MGRGNAEKRLPWSLRPNAHLQWLPATHDIGQNPLFKGLLSRWFWRFCTYRITPAGRWLIWVTIIIGLLGSTSLDLQIYVVFFYLAPLWLVALLIALCRPPRVLLQAAHAERIYAGETLPVEIRLEQRRRMADHQLAVLPINLPLGIEAEPALGAPAPRLRAGEAARVQLGLRAWRRGVYALQGYRVQSDFPFGILNAYQLHRTVRPLLVYPRFTPLASLALPPGHRDQPGGVALQAQQGDSFELLGNREYREGDNIRNIDWRATARMQTVILREYTQEQLQRVGVVLDTRVTTGARGAEAENFERAVSVCAAVSDFMARQDYLVDIFAAGPTLYHLTAGQSLSYLDEILDILACVEGSPHEPFAALEPEIAQALGKISLVICVLLEWDATRQRFVETLAMHGVAVKIIVVRDEPCALDTTSAPITRISQAEFAAGVEVL